MRVHRNDTVLVVQGKDKGKQGRVLAVYPKKNRVLVEGVNLVKKHVKANPNLRQAGIITQPSKLNVAKVKVICGKCERASRIGYEVRRIQDGDEMKRQKTRVCKRCNETLE